jgi:tRNA threonylcarbamoyladenosine biosynthesis protein TsaB
MIDLVNDHAGRKDSSIAAGPRMKLLLIDTCGAEGSIALADGPLAEPVVAQRKMPGRQASERLVATVREAMAGCGWRLPDLAAVAVVTGPGSFTGVRVGLSVAKGLCEAAGLPLIAVSRLAVMAAAAGQTDRTESAPACAKVCALLDAGRGDFYCGQFRGGEPLGEALFSREDAIAAAARAELAVACEAMVANSLSPEIAVRLLGEPAAADALPIVLKRLAAASFDDPLTLDANYLRRTDAEIFAKPAAARPG